MTHPHPAWEAFFDNPTEAEIKNLHKFIKESNRIEGIIRHPSKAEKAIHAWFLRQPAIGVAELEQFVSAVQPRAVLRDRIGLNVRVGDHIAPAGAPEIRTNLMILLQQNIKAQPLHQAYLNLHPFTDGNGRSSRALWLYMMGPEALHLGFLHLWYYQSLSAGDRR